MTGSTAASPPPPHYAHAFDVLATLVAVVRTDGVVVFANAALEDVMGVSRRTIEGALLASYFNEPDSLANALKGAQTQAFATLRYDACCAALRKTRCLCMSSWHPQRSKARFWWSCSP